MTADEHAHVQTLEGKVKRYRSRIVALKMEIEQLRAALGARGGDAALVAGRCTCGPPSFAYEEHDPKCPCAGEA